MVRDDALWLRQEHTGVMGLPRLLAVLGLRESANYLACRCRPGWLRLSHHVIEISRRVYFVALSWLTKAPALVKRYCRGIVGAMICAYPHILGKASNHPAYVVPGGGCASSTHGSKEMILKTPYF